MQKLRTEYQLRLSCGASDYIWCR